MDVGSQDHSMQVRYRQMRFTVAYDAVRLRFSVDTATAGSARFQVVDARGVVHTPAGGVVDLSRGPCSIQGGELVSRTGSARM